VTPRDVSPGFLALLAVAGLIGWALRRVSGWAPGERERVQAARERGEVGRIAAIPGTDKRSTE
jgi:hypothetical protein